MGPRGEGAGAQCGGARGKGAKVQFVHRPGAPRGGGPFAPRPEPRAGRPGKRPRGGRGGGGARGLSALATPPARPAPGSGTRSPCSPPRGPALSARPALTRGSSAACRARGSRRAPLRAGRTHQRSRPVAPIPPVNLQPLWPRPPPPGRSSCPGCQRSRGSSRGRAGARARGPVPDTVPAPSGPRHVETTVPLTVVTKATVESKLLHVRKAVPGISPRDLGGAGGGGARRGGPGRRPRGPHLMRPRTARPCSAETPREPQAAAAGEGGRTGPLRLHARRELEQARGAGAAVWWPLGGSRSLEPGGAGADADSVISPPGTGQGRRYLSCISPNGWGHAQMPRSRPSAAQAYFGHLTFLGVSSSAPA